MLNSEWIQIRLLLRDTLYFRWQRKGFSVDSRAAPIQQVSRRAAPRNQWPDWIPINHQGIQSHSRTCCNVTSAIQYKCCGTISCLTGKIGFLQPCVRRNIIFPKIIQNSAIHIVTADNVNFCSDRECCSSASAWTGSEFCCTHCALLLRADRSNTNRKDNLVFISGIFIKITKNSIQQNILHESWTFSWWNLACEPNWQQRISERGYNAIESEKLNRISFSS